MTIDPRDLLSAQLRRNGGVLPLVPDGPLLPRFDARELSSALDSEVNRAAAVGHSKIRIDLDLDDARALASFLRRRA